MSRKAVPAAVLAVVVFVAAVVAAWWLLGRPGSGAGGQAPGAQASGPPAVLLIPGFGGDVEPLDGLRTELAASGYEVEVLDIADGTGDLTEYGGEAIERADALLADGASSVSTVGYSAGGLIGRVAAVEEPDLFEKVISLATPHEGTLWALLGGANCPTACQQMKPNSEFLEGLPDAPDADSWLSVYSTSDEVIVPATSSRLPGATVVTLQEVEPGSMARHGDVPADPIVIAQVKGFLPPASTG